MTNSTLAAELWEIAANAGGFSELEADGGEINFNNATLDITSFAGLPSTLNIDYTIVDATLDGSGGLASGQFLSLSEGAVIYGDENISFQISYGNVIAEHITLTTIASIPEPSTYAMLSFALMGWAGICGVAGKLGRRRR